MGRGDTTDHQEKGTEHVCNTKSDGKRKERHVGQKKGGDPKQSLVFPNWLAWPQGHICLCPWNMASETTASRKSWETLFQSDEL